MGVCTRFSFSPPAAAVTALAAAVFAGSAAAPRPALAASPAAQQRDDGDPLVDTVANGRGRVNYNTGTVRATGYGAPSPRANTPAQARLMARGAAIADALRNLAMSVSSVQVTATTRVKNYELQNDEVATRIDALLESPRIVSDRFQPDGTAVVVVELPLYGKDSVASVVLPEVLKGERDGDERDDEPRRERAAGGGYDANGNFVGPSVPAIPVLPPRRAPIPPLAPGREPGPTPASDPGPFTSVIVDCRGLRVSAVMSPKLYDTTGREIYGTVRVSPDYAIETGIVAYPRSMAEALRGSRAGAHPLIVRAVRVADKHRFNPVISLEDADRILAANSRDGFLPRTAVIFLVDPVRL